MNTPDHEGQRISVRLPDVPPVPDQEIAAHFNPMVQATICSNFGHHLEGRLHGTQLVGRCMFCGIGCEATN